MKRGETDIPNLVPREPTPKEKRELIAYNTVRAYENPTREDRDEQAMFVEAAAIAVFDDYITGGPGYAGKLMMVVWDGSPSFYEVYTWRDGSIEHVAKEN